MTRKRRLPANVTSFVDRHGKERFRYRKTGRPVHYFKAPFGTPEFLEEHAACEAEGPIRAGAGRATPGSIDDLVVRFYVSTAFANAGPGKRRANRGIVESFRAEFGKDRVRDFTFEHIEAILTAKAEKKLTSERKARGGPSAAVALHKLLKRLFRLAVKLGWIERNPADLADGVKAPKTGGFHTWTEAEIAQYQKRHPLGTKARLALEIILWTGQRRGDAAAFGPAHVQGGRILYTAGKTKKDIGLPVAPALLAAIRAMPSVGITTYLVTDFGKPFSKAGFGNWFRDRCDEAGLPQCSAHGLRKAIARRLAESGAGNQGIKAVGGWSGDTEVSTYTAEVDQRALADTTLGRLFGEPPE
jgi:integrase